MKLLLLILLLIPMRIAAQTEKPEQLNVFAGVVTRVESSGAFFVLDTTDRRERFLAWEDWPAEWNHDVIVSIAPNGIERSVTLIERPQPVKGQIIEAFWYRNGLQPIEPCDYRINQRLVDRASKRPGEPPALSDHERKDCGKLSGFIEQTVNSVKDQQQPQNRSDKRCVVTEVVVGGTRSDCGGWSAAKGEKLIMPAVVNKRLKVGDVFYFVWKTDRWVAEIR